jgi:hypothetical protein
MTTVGNSYIMFGGLLVSNDLKKECTKAEPTDDVYMMRIGQSKSIHFSSEIPPQKGSILFLDFSDFSRSSNLAKILPYKILFVLIIDFEIISYCFHLTIR